MKFLEQRGAGALLNNSWHALMLMLPVTTERCDAVMRDLCLKFSLRGKKKKLTVLTLPL